MSNDNTIVPFKPKLVEPVTHEVTEPAADADVIKMLEFYLEKARTGKITFAAIAFIDEAGAATSTWAPESYPNEQATTKAIGAVAYLNARFMNSVVNCERAADDWEGPEKA
ncbi:hypothetical protein [Bradyrhizobium cenepequi]